MGPDARAAMDQLAPSFAPDALICDPVELGTYSCDGLTQFRARPAFAVLAGSGEDIQMVVKVCAGLKLPFVARGSGTGLSGGSVPKADGALARHFTHANGPGGTSRRPIGPCSSQVSPTSMSAGPPFPTGSSTPPGPVQPAGLLCRWQRSRELRRRSLPEVRVYDQPHHRSRSGDARRGCCGAGQHGR